MAQDVQLVEVQDSRTDLEVAQVMKAEKCVVCGTFNPATANFCQGCGRSVSDCFHPNCDL